MSTQLNHSVAADLVAFSFSRMRGLSPEQMLDVKRAQEAAHDAHGLVPCTQALAAAHEAGHIIVAWCMGEQVRRSQLRGQHIGDLSLWSGETLLDDGYPEGAFIVDDDPVRALRAVINCMAGVVGEELAGIHHPSSAIEDRCIASGIGERLDFLQGKQSGFSFQFAAWIARQCITINRDAFNAVRGYLELVLRLDAAGANHILAKAHRMTEAEQRDYGLWREGGEE